MPEMNGLEATRAIRALERGGLRRVPIIAMTASALIDDKNRFAWPPAWTAISPNPSTGDHFISLIERIFEVSPPPRPRGGVNLR